jgi:septum formation protein
MTEKKIYLASRSPRRADLLMQMQVAFDVLPSDIDETPLADELPEDYVLRLARQKAIVCLDYMRDNGLPARPVLAADTTVSVDDAILGKPETEEDAVNMLKLMSNRWHEVHTGVAVANGNEVETVLSTTWVEMPELPESLIRAYVASGEPLGKAGSYGIQGLASTFIKRINGSYSGVMGLPVFETSVLLENAGIHLL